METIKQRKRVGQDRQNCTEQVIPLVQDGLGSKTVINNKNGNRAPPKKSTLFYLKNTPIFSGPEMVCILTLSVEFSFFSPLSFPVVRRVQPGLPAAAQLHQQRDEREQEQRQRGLGGGRGIVSGGSRFISKSWNTFKDGPDQTALLPVPE